MSNVKTNKHLFENTTFLFLGLGLHSPAPNARDPDVNGSRARRTLSISVTLPSCKTNSKLQFETEPVSPITEAFTQNDLFPPPISHIRTCN